MLNITVSLVPINPILFKNVKCKRKFKRKKTQKKEREVQAKRESYTDKETNTGKINEMRLSEQRLIDKKDLPVRS